MRSLVLVVSLAAFGCVAETTDADLQVNDDVAVDALFDEFSSAYGRLDAEAVTDLYTDDGLYLSSSMIAIRRGRDEIANAFQWLTSSLEKGATRSIEFRSVDRTISGNLAYDVGYYRSTLVTSEGEVHRDTGKFTVVLKRLGGAWQFHVDSYSAAPNEAFDDARAD